MRLDEPRLDPIELADADPETRALLQPLARDGYVPRIYRTLARHPKLLKRWLVFGSHVLIKSSLPAREREIVILRVGWLCRAEYEWAMHVDIGLRSGLTRQEIERIAEGPETPGLDPFDRVLLRAADELHGDAFLSDETWQALSERLDEQQLIDLIFTVGQYNLVSMALNSLGVQLEQGASRFPGGAR